MKRIATLTGRNSNGGGSSIPSRTTGSLHWRQRVTAFVLMTMLVTLDTVRCKGSRRRFIKGSSRGLVVQDEVPMVTIPADVLLDPEEEIVVANDPETTQLSSTLPTAETETAATETTFEAYAAPPSGGKGGKGGKKKQKCKKTYPPSKTHRPTKSKKITKSPSKHKHVHDHENCEVFYNENEVDVAGYEPCTTGIDDADIIHFNMDMIVLYSGTKEGALDDITSYLQDNVGDGLSACRGDTISDTEDPHMLYVNFTAEEGNIVCSIDSCLSVDVNIDVYCTECNQTQFQETLTKGIEEDCDGLTDLGMIYPSCDNDPIILVPGGVTPNGGGGGDGDSNDTDSGAVGIADGAPVQRGLSTGGRWALIAAALLVILLFALFAIIRGRRDNKSRGPLKHSSLDDEYDDGTYLKDDMETYTEPSSPGSHRGAYDRDSLVRVVGDDDSLLSGASGFSRNSMTPVIDSRFGSRNANQDVHVCASAYCEACQGSPQQPGLQFIPPMPTHSHTSLPDDAERSYVTSNTVDL